MAPTRDREGHLEHEAYLFFRPEAFGLFDRTEKGFPIPRWYRRLFFHQMMKKEQFPQAG